MNADDLWTGLDEDEEWEELIPSRFKKVTKPVNESDIKQRQNWYD